MPYHAIEVAVCSTRSNTSCTKDTLTLNSSRHPERVTRVTRAVCHNIAVPGMPTGVLVPFLFFNTLQYGRVNIDSATAGMPTWVLVPFLFFNTLQNERVNIDSATAGMPTGVLVRFLRALQGRPA